MNANSFYISDTSYERILQTAEHDLAAMARAKNVEEEIRFTQYRLRVFLDTAQRESALAHMRLLQDTLAGIMQPVPTPAFVPEPKPRHWEGGSR
jgi:hypothetical protein